MKKAFLLITSLLLFSNSIAQNKLLLELRDGTVKEGFGKIKANETILFKKTQKKSKKEIYNFKTVKKLTMYEDGTAHNYEYKIINDSGIVIGVKLLEVIITGKTNLYKDLIKEQAYSIPTGMGIEMGEGFSYGQSRKSCYISKGKSDSVYPLRYGNIYSNWFKKKSKNYFKSCPDLLSKINNKYFKRYDVESVIKYYNEICGD